MSDATPTPPSCFRLGSDVQGVSSELAGLRRAIEKRDLLEVDQSLKRLSYNVRAIGQQVGEAAPEARALGKRVKEIQSLLGEHVGWRSLAPKESKFLLAEVSSLQSGARPLELKAAASCGAMKLERSTDEVGFNKIPDDLKKISKERRVVAEKKFRAWRRKVAPWEREVPRKKR